MLRLIESRSNCEFYSNTTAASAAVHLLLIIAALYIVVARASLDPQPATPIRIHWLTPTPPAAAPAPDR